MHKSALRLYQTDSVWNIVYGLSGNRVYCYRACCTL